MSYPDGVRGRWVWGFPQVPRLPMRRRGLAFGALATAAALSIMIGNPLGEIITGYLSWQWIFHINIPVGIIAMFVCWKVILKDVPKMDEERSGIDPAGVLFCFASLLALMYALNRLAEFGWRSQVIWSSIAVGAAAMTAFLFRERASISPLLDYALFRNREFSFGNVANFLAYFFLAGNNFIIPFYLMIVKGLNPQHAGLVLLTYSLVFV